MREKPCRHMGSGHGAQGPALLSSEVSAAPRCPQPPPPLQTQSLSLGGPHGGRRKQRSCGTDAEGRVLALDRALCTIGRDNEDHDLHCGSAPLALSVLQKWWPAFTASMSEMRVRARKMPNI